MARLRPNALLGNALAGQVGGDAHTLGELITRTKTQVLRHEASKFTQQVDALAAMFMKLKPAQLAAERNDNVRHYNLLDDPGLVLRRPQPAILLSVSGSTVTVETAASEVLLTLERSTVGPVRAPASEKIDPGDPQIEKKLTDRYRKTNDRVLDRWTVRPAGGKATVAIELPKEPGKYWLKAFAPGLVGACALEVPEKQASAAVTQSACRAKTRFPRGFEGFAIRPVSFCNSG